jgi:hypothetical protein
MAEITVIITLATVMGYAGIKVYNLLKSNGKSPCDNCEGCALKEQLKSSKFDGKDKKRT